MIANAGSNTLERRKNEIQRLIPDENLRHIIFNYEDTLGSFMKNDKRMIRYFYNALVVTSYVVYRAFLDWKTLFNMKSTDEKEREMEKFSNSTIRLFNLLESCYDIKKFDLDFIENLVLNLQIDSNITPNGANDFLRIIGLNNCFRFNDNLTKYIYKLKRSRISSRQEQNFDFDNLCDCFEMMFYLSKSTAALGEYECSDGAGLSGVIISCDRPHFSLNLGKLLCVVNDITYYLEDFDIDDPRKFTENNMSKCQSLTLNYIALSKSYLFKVHMKDSRDIGLTGEYLNDEEYALYDVDIVEKFLMEYNVININTQPETQGENESYFFKDYISFNNRYIKYLALTISDFISFETKQRILQNYMNRYNEVFKKLHVRSLYDNSGVQYYRWDEVIIFLLLEEGVFEFLTFLLRHENYGSFILAFRRRFGNQKIDEIKKSNILVDKPTLNLQYRNKESEIKNHAKAIILLATKLLTIDDVNYSGFYFSPSIGDIISDLQKKHESEKLSPFEHISYSVNLLIRVVLFVDAFYTGLLHYASEWKYWELSFSEDGSKSYEDYRAKRETVLRDVFSKEVNKKKSQNLYFAEFNHIRDSSLFLEKAADTVRKVFDQFINTNSQATERENSINEALYEALGKRELFSETAMSQHRDSICSLLEVFAKNSTLGRTHCEKLYKEILRFFKYLQNGSSNENAMLENAIYPLVGAYSNGVISRDGYRYSFMTVSKSNDERPIKIKMITDEVFDFGHMYYCVPNIKRVANITDSKTKLTERIWINPTIIPHQYYSSNISPNRLE